MEVREFKKWLIDNGFEDDELYQESLKCYQVEAYKAAYIFSYLANHKYIARLAIDYRGTPSNFMSDLPEDKHDIKEARWEEKIKSLQNEDEWEDTVNDILIQAKDTNNVFRLPDKIKKKYSHMRVLRNNAAHAKDRLISESTVLELWNEIHYIYPYFVINGTIDAWLDELDKVVKYLSDSSDVDDLLMKFNYYPIDNKTIIVKKIIKKYLIDYESDNDYPKVVTTFLFDALKNKKNAGSIGQELSAQEEIYLFMCIGEYEFQNNIIDLFKNLKKLSKDNQFRCFCYIFSTNFWKFIDIIYSKIKEIDLIKVIFDLLEYDPSELLNCDFNESVFLKTDDSFFKNVIEKISRLYHYKMFYTGNETHKTKTFDYSKFYSYIIYIVYVSYRISENPNLKEEVEVQEFLKRCKKLMTDDYSGEGLSNQRTMQARIKEINARYNLI